jgi:hypothetical protein
MLYKHYVVLNNYPPLDTQNIAILVHIIIISNKL